MGTVARAAHSMKQKVLALFSEHVWEGLNTGLLFVPWRLQGYVSEALYLLTLTGTCFP